MALAHGFKSSLMRVYRYARERWERRMDVGDGDPHHDMGLLTLIPCSTSPALDILEPRTSEWLPIEEQMKSDDAIIFGGVTLARLTGIPGAPDHPAPTQPCVPCTATRWATRPLSANPSSRATWQRSATA